MVEVIERNLQECFKSFGIIPNSVVTDSDVVAVRTPVNLTFTNGVAIAKVSSNDVENQINEILAPYKAHATPLRWWVTPSSQPSDLGEALLRCGMRRIFQIPAMGLNLDDLSENAKDIDGFSIQPVDNVDQLSVWSRIFTIGFEMIGESAYEQWLEAYLPFGFGEDRVWRLYVGYLHGEPVALSAAFLGSEAVGIYHVITLDQARRLGIGTAMTLRPIIEARAKGYRYSVLQSSDMGFSLYMRMGFEQHFIADFYSWRPQSPTSNPK